MSDHRFSIDVKFSIYGQNYHWNPSLNWYSPDDQVDYRITEWFAHCYADARAKWDHQNNLEDQRRETAKLERAERAELARLKTKYEPGPCGRINCGCSTCTGNSLC